MSNLPQLLFILVIICLQCVHKVNTLNSNETNDNNLIIGDNTKQSVCITDKYDLISSFYNKIIYDPRIDMGHNSPKLTCKDRTIWISQDTKYVIYYQLFTDSIISGFNNAMNISGFGIFECSADSYLNALKSQTTDIKSNNLCVDPISIMADTYPGSQCKGKPMIYCLPFTDKSKCPQFQMTMNSMYNKIDLNKDLNRHMNNFYECNCWYKSNMEGDTNNDEQINININFNENCKQIIKQNKREENEQYVKNRREAQQENMDEEKKERDEYEQEIEVEKNKEFSILWASLGFILGVILLIIVVIYSCRKQWEKKMYLTSRKYYRNAHYGEVENDNLINDDSSFTESDTDKSGIGDTDESDISDLSNELAYDDDTTNFSESITNYNTENTTLRI